MDRKKSNRSAGFTLVELLCVFALLGVLLAVASVMLFSTADIYAQARESRMPGQAARTVSGLLKAELQGAQPQAWGPGEAWAVCVDQGGQRLRFTGPDGYRHTVAVQDGSLVEWYEKDGKTIRSAWDEAALLGCEADHLLVNYDGADVLQLTLVLRDRRGETQTFQTPVRLRHFYDTQTRQMIRAEIKAE